MDSIDHHHPHPPHVNFPHNEQRDNLTKSPHHHHNHHHNYHHHHHHHHHNHRSMELVFNQLTLLEPCKLPNDSAGDSSSGKSFLNCFKSTQSSSSPLSPGHHHPNPMDEDEILSVEIVNDPHRDPSVNRASPSSQRPTKATTVNSRCILNDISGYAKAGQVLGIMGPSGSGKSSLLNILSGRLKPNQGYITFNGETLNKRIRRKINYVLQHDIFLPDLTLKQTLTYTALLRLPESMSYSQKMKQVDNIISLLDLGQCVDTIIGDMLHRGLSGGEKKRANIACELLSNPSVMLLDEPTSGLDSSTAFDIMKFLKDYAVKERKTVVTSIHQPSSQIFYLLDKVLLLSGGQLAYFGDTHSIVPFFSSIGYEITPHYNPADFMIERIKASPEDREKIVSAARRLNKLPTAQRSRPPSLSSSSPSAHNHHHHHHHHHHHQNRMKSGSISHHSHDSDNHSHKSVDHNQHDHQTDSNQPYSQCDEDDINNHVTLTPPNSVYHSSNEHERVDGETENDEVNPLWPGGGGGVRDASDPGNPKSPASTELRVLIDPCCKKLTKIYTKIVNDDDSGRSSLTETDRYSTVTFSSSSSTASSEEMYYTGIALSPSSRYSSTGRIGKNESYTKWPTSFWTQCKVLTQRNFHESKGRMLSKLNWIQAIVLGMVTGLIWFQIPRKESSINDIRGWMFFATSYWMLFALFGTLVALPAEKEVINKERASGCYRLSAYYIAKLIGELPCTVTLPSVFYLISYPMFSFYSVSIFIVQWLFFILNSIVASTIGFVIGVTTNDLEISMTISALYSMSTNLFGGFYSSLVPPWLTWAKYFSIVHYAFQNMQIIELTYGPPIKCSPSLSKYPSCLRGNETISMNGIFEERITFIPKDELLAELETIGGSTGLIPIWLNTLILISFLIFFQLFGYLTLRYYRKHK